MKSYPVTQRLAPPPQESLTRQICLQSVSETKKTRRNSENNQKRVEESVSVLGQYYMLLSGSEYCKNKSYLSQNGVVFATTNSA